MTAKPYAHFFKTFTNTSPTFRWSRKESIGNIDSTDCQLMTNSSQCYFQENGPRKLTPHGGRLLKTIQFQYFACHTNVYSSAALSEKTRVVSCFKIKFINTNVLLWEVTFNTSTQ